VLANFFIDFIKRHLKNATCPGWRIPGFNVKFPGRFTTNLLRLVLGAHQMIDRRRAERGAARSQQTTQSVVLAGTFLATAPPAAAESRSGGVGCTLHAGGI